MRRQGVVITRLRCLLSGTNFLGSKRQQEKSVGRLLPRSEHAPESFVVHVPVLISEPSRKLNTTHASGSPTAFVTSTEALASRLMRLILGVSFPANICTFVPVHSNQTGTPIGAPGASLVIKIARRGLARNSSRCASFRKGLPMNSSAHSRWINYASSNTRERGKTTPKRLSVILEQHLPETT